MLNRVAATSAEAERDVHTLLDRFAERAR